MKEEDRNKVKVMVICAVWFVVCITMLGQVVTERAKGSEIHIEFIKLKSAIAFAAAFSTAIIVTAILGKDSEYERRMNVLRACIPQTYGEAIVKFPFIECEGHEWDNRRTEENACWIVEQLLAATADQFAEIERLKKEFESNTVHRKALFDQNNALITERCELRKEVELIRSERDACHEQFKRILETLPLKTGGYSGAECIDEFFKLRKEVERLKAAQAG